MAGDDFRRVFQGQPRQIPARAWTGALAAADDLKSRQLGTAANLAVTFPPTGIIYVRNDSGAARDRFDVLGLGNPLVLPSDSLDEFQRRVTFSGVTPGDTPGRFVVLQESLPADAIGRALVDGVTLGRVLVDAGQADEGYADVIAGDPTQLRVTACGGAQVLWHDTPDGGSGSGSGSGGGQTVNAVLRLGVTPCGGGEGTPFPVVTSVCAGSGGGVVVQYQVYDPASGLLGAPYCVTNPTDCCAKCNCGAVEFLVTGEGFSGPFAGFDCNVSNLPCCPGPVPAVACVKIIGGPLDGTEVLVSPNPAFVPGVFFGTLAFPAPGCKTTLVDCVTDTVYLQVTWNPCEGVLGFGFFDTPDPLSSPPVGASLTGVSGNPCDPGSTLSYTGGQFVANGVGSGFGYETYSGEAACTAAGADGIGAYKASTCFPFLPDQVAGLIGGPFTAQVTYGGCGASGSGGGSSSGLNGPFLVTSHAPCIWTYQCAGSLANKPGGNVFLDPDDIATITYYAPTGDTAVYQADVSAGCCGTFTATLYSTSSPGNVPLTVTLQGIGCPEGPSSGSGSGGGVCSGISSAAMGTASGTGSATLAAVNMPASTMLLVLAATHSSGGDLSNVTFAGAPMTRMVLSGSLSEDVELWYRHITSNLTGSVIATGTGTDPVLLTAREVLCLPNFAAGVSSSGNDATGTTNPDTGTTGTTPTAVEFALAGAMMAAVGAGGTWTASGFTAGQSVSLVSGGVTYTLSEAWQVLSATGTVDAIYAGASPKPTQWGAVVGTFS
jgi:hypothetical protein